MREAVGDSLVLIAGIQEYSRLPCYRRVGQCPAALLAPGSSTSHGDLLTFDRF